MVKRILGLALLLAGTSSFINVQQLKTVIFVPHWLPQAQFAGYYVGRDLGIYKKHGIELKILTGGPNVSSPFLLEQGKVDFASVWLSNAIRLKANGVDIVNIAQLIPRSALMLVAKKSSGIKTPKDMNGKKVGLWGGDFQIQPMAFFRKFNLHVKTVLQGSSINLFFFDGVDVTSAMWYNEYHTILISGLHPDELNTFFFSDYGFNFPEEGIYCLARFCKTAPETCKQFVLATLEGWKYAFEHPEVAIGIVTGYMVQAKLPVNKAHQRWMLARMKDLIFPGNKMDDFQELAEPDYLFVATSLKESGSIKNIPSYSSLYRPIFTRNDK
jgi:NitT/TauT family transport system substrate-binding protein